MRVMSWPEDLISLYIRIVIVAGIACITTALLTAVLVLLGFPLL